LRSHRSLILNYFRAKEQIALGAVEGLNNKAKMTTKKAYGFKNFGSSPDRVGNTYRAMLSG
jgi:transposase